MPDSSHSREPKPDAKERFIIDLYPAALKVAQQTGLSWELMLAQAAQETGWGQKVLPGTHNLFNVKADRAWTGLSKHFKVPEYDRKTHTWLSEDQAFRVYKSYVAALTDRVAFLRSNARYTMAGLFKKGTKGNLRKEAMALQHGHYATDPEYAKHIVAVFDGATMQTAIKDAKAYAAAHAAEATH